MKKRIISLLMCGLLTVATPVMAVAEADVPVVEEVTIEGMVAPDVTPEVTVTPEVSPEITVEPEVMDETEIVAEPEVIVEPELTDTPEITIEPEVTPEVIVLPEFNMSRSARVAGDIAIDAINFPDAVFRKAVKEHFDKNKDGSLSKAEQEAVIEVSLSDDSSSIVHGASLTSIKGIEFFVNLESLDVTYTGLTQLDVSKNLNLVTLNCGRNNLTSLDVSKNTKLENLYCRDNNLTSLNISNNTNLKYLACDKNKLTNLDVSNNTNLRYLECPNNKLTKLDLRNNPNLVMLNISKNNLTSLELGEKLVLEWLHCQSNNLTQIDVSKTPMLETFNIAGNKLKKLDLKNCRALDSLNVSSNNLTSINLSDCINLDTLLCNSNRLTKIDLSNCRRLTELDCSDNKLKNIDISKNTDLWHVGVSNNELKNIDISKNAKLVGLRCNNNKITSISGLEKRTDMVTLQLKNNKIKTIPNLKKFKKLGINSTDTFGADFSGNYIAESELKSKSPERCLKDKKWLKAQVDGQRIRQQTGVRLVDNGANSINVTWSRTVDAQGYRIYRAASKDGVYKGIKNVSALSFIDTKLKPGVTYYYKVRAYKKVGGKTVFGTYSNIVSRKAELNKPTVALRVKSESAIDLSWKRVSGATKYQIYRATSAKGTYKRIKTVTGLKFADTKLAKNKTYFYKVRAVQTISGKTYTRTSAVVSAKTKK